MRVASFLCVLALAGCGDQPLPQEPDPTPAPSNAGPEVVGSSPADGAVGIARAISIAVVFSAPVNPVTVHATSVGLWRDAEPVIADLVLDGAVVRIVPRELLDLGTVYSVTVTRDVRDTAGAPLVRSYRSVFTTKLNRIP
jgi:hypothetical protein